MSLAPNSAMQFLPANMLGGMPRIILPDGRAIIQPHVEWYHHQLTWRRLVDSWEGGEAYRMAVYGFDLHGMPIRNMIRHKREYPGPEDQTYSVQTGRPAGTDPYNQATDDDYELRRARTPVPGFLAEVVDRHLGKIYKKEIKRDGPPEITAWWLDVNGRGNSIDQWMAETVAPLLLVLGQLDICLDHPPVPKGEEVTSRAVEIELGLDAVVASYILPENIIWWTLDECGCYEEVLIREVQDDNSVLWRYWNEEVWCLYDLTGNLVSSDYQPYDMDVSGKPKAPFAFQQDESRMRGEVVKHGYGMVPIVRIFDRRRPRCRNVGLPRYEMIADLQREYYNRDSELILSDTIQAHPLLMAPDDYVTPDGTVPIGPNWLLPKKKSTMGTTVSYEGFEVLEFPKGGAESLRANKNDIRDGVDRLAGLTKPAGASGSSGQTVSQSGISKQLDATTGHDLLGNISKSLQRTEEEIAELFWLIQGNGKPDEASVEKTKVQYPAEFSLQSTDQLAAAIIEFQAILASSTGEIPETEGELYTALLNLMLPGLDDDKYQEMDKEIRDYLATKASEAEANREMTGLNGMMNGVPANAPPGTQPPNGAPSASGQAAPATAPVTGIAVHPTKGTTAETITLGQGKGGS